MTLSTFIRLILVGMGILALAACRSEAPPEAAAGVTEATVPPRSTPLPAVPTVIPPGAEGNAIRMVVRPVGPAADAASAADDFEAAVLERSGLVVEVQLMDRYAEGLAALCAATGEQVSVAWLNAPTYAAALARNCGMPVLQVERDGATGAAGSIIVSANSRRSGLQQLTGSTFCRLGYDDFYSWFVPSLVIRANGLDTANTPQEIVEQDTTAALIQAVAAGECDAGGVPADVLEESDSVTVIATTIPFPYAVLMMPVEMPLGQRLALAEALKGIAASSADAVLLRTLLAQDSLKPATTEDFTELMDFMSSTRLDFAQLGN